MCSILILQVSDLCVDSDTPRASQRHAEEVMLIAKVLFSRLRGNNIFRPKVLAEVSYDKKCFAVGSSIAVSYFLRPLFLYRRISHFNPVLQKAIISFQPLDTTHIAKQEWSSQAFHGNGFETRKAPCQNCKKMFSNLAGFIARSEEESRPAEGGNVESSRTFLSACAEYCPVNQLLGDLLKHDEETFSEDDKALIITAMEGHKDRCTVLFTDYHNIANDCSEAHQSQDDEWITNVYCQVRHKVRVFGLKPECNDQFVKNISS